MVRAGLLVAMLSDVFNVSFEADAQTPPTNPLTSADAREKVRAAIGHYRQLALSEAWVPAPERDLSPGAGTGLSQAQRKWVIGRLLATGELSAAGNDPGPIPAERFSSAIKIFQQRHGLLPDGTICPATWQALNTSPLARAQQLEQSLTELNRLAGIISTSRYLLVNIPAFEVIGVQNGRVEIRSAVVVGNRAHQTPVLDTSVRAVNFHPRWHVPPSIVASRLYPSLSADPHFLAREGYELFHAASRKPLSRDEALAGLAPGQILFEKSAGPHNPLGRIRLDMPNSDAIFLHDSPQTWLYARPSRAMSAGCVRVARIVELTAWLLAGTTYSDLDALGEVLRGFKPQTVELPEPVPIHLAYFSAWVDQSGQVQFRNDIYGRSAPD